ncbi:MAG: VOC family protein [Hyphomicrobiaceae bacterium]
MTSWKHGAFYWNELLTNDVDAARDFYVGVLGWTFDEMAMSDGSTYWVAMHGEQPLAGIMAMPSHIPAGTPAHWLSYIAVDNIDSRLAQAKAAGAMVMREPFDISGVGRIAILQDAGGAVVGWITPASESPSESPSESQ